GGGALARGSGRVGGRLGAPDGSFTYTKIRGWLSNYASTADDKTAIKNLPLLSATAGNKFVLAGTQANALGLLSSYNNAFDGYIGFGNGVTYDFDRSNGISPGPFDFVGLAEREINHVLGHFSGIGDGYATAFDLFRCAIGASTFSNAAGSYFSIDGCQTNLATFNSTGSGDRDDWASSPTSTDIQGAFLFPGVQYSISSADITALDVIGWGTKSASSGGISISLPNFSNIGRATAAVPEASTLTLFGVGMLGAWVLRRLLAA